MSLRHIVAASNDGDEGRAVVQVATSLGQRFRARVTVLAVAHEPLREHGLAQLTKALRELVASQLQRLEPPHPPVHYAVQFGLPAVEIGRFAEGSDADLVVAGRPAASHPPANGDAVDSVARRSRVSCLFVKPDQSRFEQLLVAIDGSERGLSVLHTAVDFARGTGGKIRVVTVEPERLEGHTPWEHPARVERIADAIRQVRRHGGLAPEQWNSGDHRFPPVLLRHGRVVEEVLKEVEVDTTDVLVFGCHRGGPSPATESTNIPRQLLQLCPTAVLSIPL